MIEGEIIISLRIEWRRTTAERDPRRHPCLGHRRPAAQDCCCSARHSAAAAGVLVCTSVSAELGNLEDMAKGRNLQEPGKIFRRHLGPQPRWLPSSLKCMLRAGLRPLGLIRPS